MEILTAEKYNEYEEFIESSKYGGFMQSVHWSEVKNNWGREIVVSRNADGAIAGGMLILIKSLPLGLSLLYSPHGPVFDYCSKEVLADLLEGVKLVAKKYNSVLLKIDPYIEEGEDEKIKLFTSLGFHYKAGAAEHETIQRRYNYILPDLKGKTPEEVINSFKPKCRYNIRLAERKGVECRICGKEALDDFVRISDITAARDGFVGRSKEYYARMLDSFGDKMRLYMCYYNGKAVSGAINSNVAKKVNYIFGASDNEYRNVMPNYLMQWEMIKWALETDCEVYDFLGIPVNCDENSPMYGVYKFKSGFNGRVAAYIGEMDYHFKPILANMLRLAVSLKRIPNKIMILKTKASVKKQ